ncbi:hypothetical protein RJ640_021918 [Escallonia rubra]|uniref:Uncharacterized protein n=1 Tax=Escallonia rubra TaxID=112253 RepID=A0AA88R575_9ASTE|nr:hypothetical protein RJ640_021918 [Escallonia rubra]
MGREWREAARRDGSNDGLGAAVMIFWAALVALSLISAIVLSCADGASKDKATNTDAYGGGCAAGLIKSSEAKSGAVFNIVRPSALQGNIRKADQKFLWTSET